MIWYGIGIFDYLGLGLLIAGLGGRVLYSRFQEEKASKRLIRTLRSFVVSVVVVLCTVHPLLL